MSYSFDIKDSKDLFDEFCRRSEEYRRSPMSSGNAVICAILSWHIVEWIYQEFSSLQVKYPEKRDFQNFIRQSCPSLSYMQDIANGSKHRGITFYTPAVKQTESHKGAFSSGFSKGFDVSCLKLELERGQIVYFDEELDKVEAFIKKYFQSVLGINV
jgi:hypothetical protein